mmetsp:Transcript_14665/g.20933  ORF Transcript_14665/g.20933 Transcript_14665/m.20933 type:complete len:528 (-) Transcript_14665:141-1724(-)
MTISTSSNTIELEEQYETQRKRYEENNQEQVFDHYSLLSLEEKLSLLKQLENIEVEKLSEYLTAALQERDLSKKQSDIHHQKHDKKNDKGSIQPFSGPIGSSKSSSSQQSHELRDYYSHGMRQICANRVAAVLLAGGQGTRLGFDGPKGMYDFGLPSKRTPFQLVAERLLKLTRLAEEYNKKHNPNNANNINDDDNSIVEVCIPLYIMTSPMNHEETKKYFESSVYFGLDPNNVTFFQQGTLPCLSLTEGKILLKSKSQCAMAPDGNGGIYHALSKSGCLSNMKSKGIVHIHAFAIDNVMVKPADPLFIGYCLSHAADCGNKVVWKSDPHEKVGVVAERDGKPCVVEYSELSNDMAEQRDCEYISNTFPLNDQQQQRLSYGAANICNHYYTLDFLLNVVIPKVHMGGMYHIAEKNIDIWNGTSVRGIKLESFIFDVFPYSNSMAMLQVERKDEFAPVKNAPGSSSDSPDTARSMLSQQAKRWLSNLAECVLINNTTMSTCEISPLVSYAGEGLEQYKGKQIECPFTL